MSAPNASGANSGDDDEYFDGDDGEEQLNGTYVNSKVPRIEVHEVEETSAGDVAMGKFACNLSIISEKNDEDGGHRNEDEIYRQEDGDRRDEEENHRQEEGSHRDEEESHRDEEENHQSAVVHCRREDASHRFMEENYRQEEGSRRDEVVHCRQEEGSHRTVDGHYRNEDVSRRGEDEDSTIMQMSTLTVKPADAPTFILDCTTAHFVGTPLVDVDKPCLYFGFRPLGVDSVNEINVNSLVDKPMYIKCRIYPPNNQVFKLLNASNEKQKLRAHSACTLYISFRPEKSERARATLHVSCYLGSDHPVEYKCRLLGFGGQAIVVPTAADTTKSKGLVMSANGRYQLVPDAVKKFSFCLENRGERDAFATIIVQDLSGEEFPAENLIIQPSNVLLPKRHASQKRIDVRMFAQMSSRPSLASSMTGNACNASGSSFPVAFRIIVLWGEERQRQRLKMLERRRHEKFSFLRRYFTIVKYSGEQPTWENAPVDELLSKEDYAVFQSYLRVTTIDVLDSRAGVRVRDHRPASVLSARPTSAVPTVVEIEPDNTFKIDESIAGSTLDPAI